MTYIEFFDKVASENVSTCLSYAPERVIYIGDDSKTSKRIMNKHKSNYERVFNNRGLNIEILVKNVSKNLNNVVKLLTEIVETYDNCVFDITGGEEIYILALGVVYAKYPDKNIQIHKFNLGNNVIYDCDKDGTTIYKDPPTLSIEENVRIYGGEVVYGEIFEENTYLWDFTPDFTKDIDRIWSVCRGNVRLWNAQVGVFEAIEKVGQVSEDGLATTAKISSVKAYLSKQKASYKTVKGIIRCLIRDGLLTSFDDSDETTVTISYKNEQVKKCLTKAGQALEMKMYLIAKNVLDDDGNLFYNDALNGVVIDWDGEFHDEEVEDVYDTENEIDIFLMRGIVPLFISCKNGVVTADELYKLNTVAERFGGQYSKKVLIATSIPVNSEAGKYLYQRAKDMGIKIIDDVQYSNDAQLAKSFKRIWFEKY